MTVPAAMRELEKIEMARQTDGNKADQGQELYEGPVVLVGINYDPETKEHTCEIERLAV